MSKGITKLKLKQSFPQVAEVLDRIEKVNKKNHYWFFANYSGKYNSPNGIKRAVSLNAIIDILTENGFDVDIVVKPSPTKKQLWKEIIKP
jgi:hypothetical protein